MGGTMRFTDVYLRKLKPESRKVYISEVDGFTLRIMPSGLMNWLYIYTMDGKRRELNMGRYPEISLAKARERHAQSRFPLPFDVNRKSRNNIPILGRRDCIEHRYFDCLTSEEVDYNIMKKAILIAWAAFLFGVIPGGTAAGPS
jgi:hypothetical protein